MMDIPKITCVGADLGSETWRQWARLEAELGKGPLAHGFASDQRWTLGRIKTLIGKLFRIGYTIEGTSKLMRRHGWPAQVPVRQALERDDAAVAVWKDQVWPDIKGRDRPRRDQSETCGAGALPTAKAADSIGLFILDPQVG